MRWLTNDELGRVLRSCPEWLRPIVGLLVTTGARRGELLKVRWEDVNVAGGVIRLRHTKSGKERPASVNENAAQVLASIEHAQARPVVSKCVPCDGDSCFR